MDRKIKDRWVAALRSGKYQQGQGALKVIEDGEEKYCCLGVLCDLMGVRWERPENIGKGESRVVLAATDGGDYAISYLPITIHERTGVKDVTGLANLNDAGTSFEGIANHIEQYE